MKKQGKTRGRKSRKQVKIEEYNIDIFCYSCFGQIQKTRSVQNYLKKLYQIEHKALDYNQCQNCFQYIHYYCGGNQFINGLCFLCQQKEIPNTSCIDCGIKINKRVCYAKNITNSQYWIHVICGLFSNKVEITNFNNLEFSLSTFLNHEVEEEDKGYRYDLTCDHCKQKGKTYSCVKQCKSDINNAHLVCFFMKKTSDSLDTIPWIFKIQLDFRSISEEIQNKNKNLHMYCPECVNQIYCICQNYHKDNAHIVYCEICENWYHAQCLEQQTSDNDFICKYCLDYLNAQKKSQILLSNQIQSMSLREVFSICNLLEQQIQKQIMPVDQINVIKQQIPIKFCQQKSKLLSLQQSKQNSIEKNNIDDQQGEQLAKLYDVKQENNLEKEKVIIEENELIHFNKTYLIAKNDIFFNYSKIFKKETQYNFYNFLCYFYQNVTDNYPEIQNTNLDIMCIKIKAKISDYIQDKIEDQQLHQQFSKLNILYLNMIESNLIRETIVFIYDVFLKQYFQFINDKIRKNNKQSKFINLQIIDFIEKVVNKRISIISQLEQPFIKQLDEMRINFKNCIQEGFKILENSIEFTLSLSLQKKMETLHQQRKKIDNLLNQFQKKGIDHNSLFQQLDYWKQTFEWVLFLQDSLKEMAFQNIFQYQEKLEEIYNLAIINRWNYLPLFDELKYLIEQKFDINKIANKLIKSATILSLLIKKQNLNNLEENGFVIDKQFEYYNHDYSYFFFQHFLAAQTDRNYNYKNLLQILLNTKEFIENFSQLYKEIDFLQSNTQIVFKMFEFLKNKQILYCIEVSGFLLLTWLDCVHQKQQNQNIKNILLIAENILIQKQYLLVKEKYQNLFQTFQFQYQILSSYKSPQNIEDVNYLIKLYYYHIEKKQIQFGKDFKFKFLIVQINDYIDKKQCSIFIDYMQILLKNFKQLQNIIENSINEIQQLDPREPDINMYHYIIYNIFQRLCNNLNLLNQTIQTLMDCRIYYFIDISCSIKIIKLSKQIIQTIDDLQVFNYPSKNEISSLQEKISPMLFDLNELLDQN